MTFLCIGGVLTATLPSIVFPSKYTEGLQSVRTNTFYVHITAIGRMSNGFAWISPSNSPTLLFYNSHDCPDLGNEWRSTKYWAECGAMCFWLLPTLKFPKQKAISWHRIWHKMIVKAFKTQASWVGALAFAPVISVTGEATNNCSWGF